MSCRAPGAALDVLIEVWPSGQPIHTLHNADFEPDSFDPGIDAGGVLNKPTRFAPIHDVRGRVVPYLYGGSSLDCAIFETVFHDVPIEAADKFVDLDNFAQRAHGQLVPTRDLQLVNLTSDGLHRLKVPKAELITSPAADYLQTAPWAQALHRQYPLLDGLLWMSRQRDRDHAVLLFGDRAGGALKGQRKGSALRFNDALRQAVLTLALRVGIEVA